MAKNKNYVSVRIERVKTATACKQAEHDTRVRPPSYLKTTEAIATTYIWDGEKKITIKEDPKKILEKTAVNEEKRKIVRTMVVNSAEQQQERYKETVKQKPQKGGNWFIRGIITFTNEGFPNDPKDPTKRTAAVNMMKERAKRLIERIAETHEVKPVYMSVHTDETTPHVHFMLEGGHRETGKSVSRIIKPNDCRKMQDMAGEEFADMGFVRGESRDVTGAKHKSVRESHRIEQEKLENLTKKAKKRVKDLKPQIENMENNLIQISQNYTAKIRELNRLEDTLAETERQNREAQEKAEEIKKKLDAANEEAISNKGLLNLYDNHVELKEKVERYEKFLQEKGLTEEFENWAVDYMNAKNEDFEDFETEIVSDQFDYSFDR